MSPSVKTCSTLIPEVRKKLEKDELIQILTATRLFREVPPTGLSLPTLEVICQEAKILELEKKATLEIGAPGKEQFLFEILSGYVMILDQRPSRKSVRNQTAPKVSPALLAWRIPGELLGDFQFTLPEALPRDHIEVTDFCRLLRLPAGLVRTLAQTYPQLYLNIAGNLASKAIKSRVRAQILRFPTIESKVAKLFVELLEEREFDPAITDATVINGTFHIKDIAAFLGYEYRSAQTGIQRLIHDGLINHYGNMKSGRFIVPDQKQLEQYVERSMLAAAPAEEQNVAATA